METKDILKSRGYVWKDGGDGSTKDWETVISIDNADAEREWLSAEVYNGNPKFTEKQESAIIRFCE